MKTEKIHLGLQPFIVPRLLASKELGAAVRNVYDLDQLDDADDLVVDIHFPEYITACTTSFLTGMFGPSIQKLGKYKFFRKYKISGSTKWHTSRQAHPLARIVREVLREWDQPLEMPEIPETPEIPNIPFINTEDPGPHSCPVCGGRQTVPSGFYEGGGLTTYSTGTSLEQEMCRSCSGTGVVWRP
jgi:hypothetical protein